MYGIYLRNLHSKGGLRGWCFNLSGMLLRVEQRQ